MSRVLIGLVSAIAGFAAGLVFVAWVERVPEEDWP